MFDVEGAAPARRAWCAAVSRAGCMTPCRRCLVAGMYAPQNSVIAGLVMLSMLDIALICQLGAALTPPTKPTSSVGVQMASSA
jgi:hypothetical protein